MNDYNSRSKKIKTFRSDGFNVLLAYEVEELNIKLMFWIPQWVIGYSCKLFAGVDGGMGLTERDWRGNGEWQSDLDI